MAKFWLKRTIIAAAAAVFFGASATAPAAAATDPVIVWSDSITDGASYGYSCACADGRFGPPGSGQVIAIDRLVERPLAACKTDPALPPP